MLGPRRNCHDDVSDASEHVKLKPLQLPSPPQRPSSTLASSLSLSQPILLLQRLQLNQHLNERITFSLELYHKNVIKKLANTSSLGKFQVFRLTKNVCQT